MALSGWMFHTRPADVDESQRPGEVPGGYVLRMAESKARACAESARVDLTILAADTAVVNGKSILGKPKDMGEAVEMLKNLRGHSHQVYTGIAVLRLSDGPLITDHQAAGFTDFANKKKVKLTRVDGRTQTVNCIKALDKPSLDPEVYPGDKIYVRRRIW